MGALYSYRSGDGAEVPKQAAQRLAKRGNVGGVFNDLRCDVESTVDFAAERFDEGSLDETVDVVEVSVQGGPTDFGFVEDALHAEAVIAVFVECSYGTFKDLGARRVDVWGMRDALPTRHGTRA